VIPIPSPHLLRRPLEGGFFYAVNCAQPHSLRLLNATQYALLSRIDGRIPAAELGAPLGVDREEVDAFLALLQKNELIRFDTAFSQPTRPARPESLNFWVHTTDRCNLGCGYCYIPTLNRPGSMGPDVRQQLLRQLLETARRRQIPHIRLRLAGGEPLSQFRAWKSFIPQARQALGEVGCQLEFSFLTNLTVLPEGLVDFAREHALRFGVSLDGVGTYQDASRAFVSGAGSFKRVEANLRTLLSAGIPVSTSTVLTNENLVGLPDLTRYLIDLDIPFRYSVVKGQPIDPVALETNLLASYALMAEAIGAGWRFSARHQFGDLKPSTPSFQTCASGFSGGALYVDGSVHYCHVQVGEQGLGRSLFEEGRDLVDLIEQGPHPEEMTSSDCQRCPFRSVCTSGCPVYRGGGKDPHCGLYHRLIPLLYDLQARERLQLLRQCRMMAAGPA
jgi:uncharacterized protein